ncbi:MAG: hypothetical protein K0S21_1822 [Rhizobiaceae bacterium]|nr:hypothetical protein [Rhizobiaceae bacterium]
MSYLSTYVRSGSDPKVLRSGRSSLSASDRMARGLGWFSIGIGLLELLQASRITRTLGMEGQEPLVRAFGAREIASGILSLSLEKHAGLWSRVAGDGLDAATLMTALRRQNRKRDNVGLALGMVAGIAVLDMVTAAAVGARHGRRRGHTRNYSDRSGFPHGVAAARGLAREDFETPPDMRSAPVAGAGGDERRHSRDV